MELGTKDDYNFTFGSQPFGLTVRHIAKMDPKAAEKAFSAFINENNLNDKQIAFIHNVINYIAVNGYMDSPMTIMKAPFDRPYSASDLFSDENLGEILHIIYEIRDNAIRYN